MCVLGGQTSKTQTDARTYIHTHTHTHTLSLSPLSLSLSLSLSPVCVCVYVCLPLFLSLSFSCSLLRLLNLSKHARHKPFDTTSVLYLRVPRAVAPAPPALCRAWVHDEHPCSTLSLQPIPHATSTPIGSSWRLSITHTPVDQSLLDPHDSPALNIWFIQ